MQKERKEGETCLKQRLDILLSGSAAALQKQYHVQSKISWFSDHFSSAVGCAGPVSCSWFTGHGFLQVVDSVCFWFSVYDAAKGLQKHCPRQQSQ